MDESDNTKSAPLPILGDVPGKEARYRMVFRWLRVLIAVGGLWNGWCIFRIWRPLYQDPQLRTQLAVGFACFGSLALVGATVYVGYLVVFAERKWDKAQKVLAQAKQGRDHSVPN